MTLSASLSMGQLGSKAYEHHCGCAKSILQESGSFSYPVPDRATGRRDAGSRRAARWSLKTGLGPRLSCFSPCSLLWGLWGDTRGQEEYFQCIWTIIVLCPVLKSVVPNGLCSQDFEHTVLPLMSFPLSFLLLEALSPTLVCVLLIDYELTFYRGCQKQMPPQKAIIGICDVT